MREFIRAILIDDEQDSLNAIEEQIKLYCPSVEIIGTFDNPFEGLEAIQTQNPDLVFLDIEMPRMNGLELARQIQTEDTHIIFVTAHDRYAINAIKLSALDYILKPMDAEELQEAVHKLASKQNMTPPETDTNRSNVIGKLISNLHNNSFSQDTIIRLPDDKGVSYVKIKDIIRLEAQRNYCLFHFTDGNSMLVSKNIGYYKSELEYYSFIQSHRSHIINSEHIKKFVRIDGPYLVMSDGSNVPVSKQYRENF